MAILYSKDIVKYVCQNEEKGKNKSRSVKNRTTLLEHKKVGKQLQPAFALIADKMTFSSDYNGFGRGYILIRYIINQNDIFMNDFNLVIIRNVQFAKIASFD